MSTFKDLCMLVCGLALDEQAEKLEAQADKLRRRATRIRVLGQSLISRSLPKYENDEIHTETH